ncbi:MAG: alpha/beta fold hydrolase [Planctomycetes bacterium]|nr:alpha/beta fold hydrolase [Planctomycetota bacterium]
MTPLLVDGPDDAFATLVLAHGAGAGMEHEWLVTMAKGLAARGLRVVRFEFPYMHARREGRRPGPDRMPKLLACYREVFEAQPAPVILSGKSMGGRAATMLADDVTCAGVVAFGYPFHPPGKPDNLRTAHLETMRTPTLIVQGERDTFGTRDEVEGYALSDQVELRWLEDGDHSLKPRKKSGFTLEGHLEAAMDAAAAFARARR